jgi:tryptophan-rich sensory protein
VRELIKKIRVSAIEDKVNRMELILDIVTTVTYIVTGASLIAAWTPSEKDDKWIGKMFSYIDLFALNFKVRK